MLVDFGWSSSIVICANSRPPEYDYLVLKSKVCAFKSAQKIVQHKVEYTSGSQNRPM